MRQRTLVGITFLGALLCPAIAAILPDPPPYPDPHILQRPYTSWAGLAYTVPVLIEGAGGGDFPDKRDSTVQLFEDGKPLGPAHADFSEIATFGGGRFMYWGGAGFMNVMIVFSSSDGTDPNTNGREYRVLDPNAFDASAKPEELKKAPLPPKGPDIVAFDNPELMR